MSVRIMTLVWAIDLPDSEKLVLLALADCARSLGVSYRTVESSWEHVRKSLGAQAR